MNLLHPIRSAVAVAVAKVHADADAEIARIHADATDERKALAADVRTAVSKARADLESVTDSPEVKAYAARALSYILTALVTHGL